MSSITAALRQAGPIDYLESTLSIHLYLTGLVFFKVQIAVAHL